MIANTYVALTMCWRFFKALYIHSVQSLSRVRFFATLWTAARPASLSINSSQSLLKLMPIESLMPSNHFMLCHPLSLPTFNLSQHQSLFKWVSSSHQVAKVLEFQLQHQSFQWIFRQKRFRAVRWRALNIIWLCDIRWNTSWRMYMEIKKLHGRKGSRENHTLWK